MLYRGTSEIVIKKIAQGYPKRCEEGGGDGYEYSSCCSRSGVNVIGGGGGGCGVCGGGGDDGG